MASSTMRVRRIKRRLERSGLKVTLVDPALAPRRKAEARGRDQRLLARGKVTATELQRRNSLFQGCAAKFRILDYGGLDEA
jgi:hypothetical protein